MSSVRETKQAKNAEKYFAYDRDDAMQNENVSSSFSYYRERKSCYNEDKIPAPIMLRYIREERKNEEMNGQINEENIVLVYDRNKEHKNTHGPSVNQPQDVVEFKG